MIKMKIQFLSFSFLLLMLMSCGNSTEKVPSNTEMDNDTKETLQVENEPSVSEQLQGKWQSLDDTSNYLLFEGDHRKEIADGMDEWTDETFVLSEKCMNASNQDAAGAEKDKYISSADSDMCWFIVKLNEKELELSYVGRGNTLAYKRVE